MSFGQTRSLYGIFTALMLMCAPPLLAKESRAPAQTIDTVRKAVEAAETAHDIQRDFPGEAGEQKTDRAPPKMEETPQPQETPDWMEKLFKFLRPLFKILGWLLLAALGAAIGYGAFHLVKSYVNRPRADADSEREAPLIDIATVEAQNWLEDAEALANRGHYGDAVHHMLLSAIDHLKKRAGKAIPRAWTAREILAQVPITVLARALLQLLVQTVERAHFAGRDISEADFIRCRDTCQQLLGLKHLRDAA
jgi:Domain of unknown function (DUF4129)